ncbi:hypothetical protein GCM10012275_56470 [Longimycelium tulufanense]|uniref:Dephospho-CoA kinase n=1 Tax=Longimycelium tulufanense TaxID=907463 RepID=A0A8J3CJJ7_9PSEU|nr:hypothetical protein [Longimycelium tulufanense]GGM78554.1 hypothetical protein GCM10012275_56470 [Longimycelium tulufanense]
MSTVPVAVGLTGYARSGKDTVARVLVEEFGYQPLALADPVREMALALDPLIAGSPSARLGEVVAQLGWDRAKERYPEVRRVLQRLGTDCVRDLLGERVWIARAAARMTVRPNDRWVITDVRFPNEAEALCDVVWRVVRPGVGPANSHRSEQAVGLVPHDVVIRNDGDVEQLRARVRVALEEYL